MEKSRYPPDECYDIHYANQSRGWYMEDQRKKEPWASEMTNSYRGVTHDPPKGARYMDLQKKLWEETVREIEAERAPKLQVEQYCSEYGGNYSANVVSPEVLEEKKAYVKELCQKYPLYRTPIMTTYRDLRRKTSVPGNTKSANTEEALFRRSVVITKPMDDVLDTPAEGF